MLSNFLLVAAGGAIGACLRYGTGLALVPLGASASAWATLAVNIIGSFAIGLLSAWGITRSLNPTIWLLVGVGVLGAFTTFSAFSRETVLMLTDGALSRAIAYAAANLFGSLIAFALGFALLRGGLS